MSDLNDVSLTPTPPRRGNPNMRPGAKSVNPAGRPKIGESLAERVRALVDPDELVGFLVSVYRDEGANMRERLGAASILSDRGWGKSTSTVDLNVNNADKGGLPASWGSMTPREKSAYLDAVEAGKL